MIIQNHKNNDHCMKRLGRVSCKTMSIEKLSRSFWLLCQRAAMVLQIPAINYVSLSEFCHIFYTLSRLILSENKSFCSHYLTDLARNVPRKHTIVLFLSFMLSSNQTQTETLLKNIVIIFFLNLQIKTFNENAWTSAENCQEKPKNDPWLAFPYFLLQTFQRWPLCCIQVYVAILYRYSGTKTFENRYLAHDRNC